MTAELPDDFWSLCQWIAPILLDSSQGDVCSSYQNLVWCTLVTGGSGKEVEIPTNFGEIFIFCNFHASETIRDDPRGVGALWEENTCGHPRHCSEGFYGSPVIFIRPKFILMKTFRLLPKWKLKPASSLWISRLLRSCLPFQFYSFKVKLNLQTHVCHVFTYPL